MTPVEHGGAAQRSSHTPPAWLSRGADAKGSHTAGGSRQTSSVGVAPSAERSAGGPRGIRASSSNGEEWTGQQKGCECVAAVIITTTISHRVSAPVIQTAAQLPDTYTVVTKQAKTGPE